MKSLCDLMNQQRMDPAVALASCCTVPEAILTCVPPLVGQESTSIAPVTTPTSGVRTDVGRWARPPWRR